MAYKLFDINNQELNYHDLQDKSRWCKDGEKLEEAFVSRYGASLGLIINPEKKINPYAPDLLNISNGKLGDLKFQSTPFFKANSLYNIDPTYAVVFNEKDKNRYQEKYPEIEIYYWINWLAIKFQMGSYIILAQPLQGVWKVAFPIFKEHLNKSSVHKYQQRLDDTAGNAKASFVCDIRDKIFTRLA